MVAAPPTQQHLAAHPLLGLWGGAGAGRTAHYVVQVLQVLGGDRLVVVAILGEEGQSRRGALTQRVSLHGGLGGDAPQRGGRPQAVPPFLSMQQTPEALLSQEL